MERIGYNMPPVGKHPPFFSVVSSSHPNPDNVREEQIYREARGGKDTCKHLALFVMMRGSHNT